MINLKKGEEHKMKEYSCVCLVKNTCNIDDLRKQIPETPLQIQQKTPIRVLHRRTVATRPKTIHTLTIHNVKIKPPQGEIKVFIFTKLIKKLFFFSFYINICKIRLYNFQVEFKNRSRYLY